jgi:uncharacterized membrane protein YsdA (DUF1294 family)
MSNRSSSGSARPLFGILSILVAGAIAVLLLQLDTLATPVAIWLGVINVVAFAVYAYDKGIAGSNRRRISENALLLLALIGGTLGALLSMIAFHHKTSKRSFQIKFLIVVAIQAAALAFFLFR